MSRVISDRERRSRRQIIHDTPKRSAIMPKREEKKVLVNGI